MQNLSLFRSFFLLITAGIVAYFFIYPQVTQIKNNQDQKEVFDSEFSRVSTVNQILTQYQSTIAAIPITDRQRLFRFLPTEVDDLHLLGDVESMLDLYGISPISLTLMADVRNNRVSQAPQTEAGTVVAARSVNVVFQSSYENIKELLLFSEMHPYILDFRDILFTPVDSVGEVRVVATMVVYLYKSQYNNLSTNI